MREVNEVEADRAVTEILGYILIFSLVTLAATSVFVIGTAQLEETRNSEQMTNAEKAFEVLAGNIQDHVSQDTIGRSTEVRMGNAELYTNDSTSFWLNISTEQRDIENITEWRGGDDHTIVYESSRGSRVAYSNGAVFREENDYSRMIGEPNMIIKNDRTVLPVIRNNGGSSAESGSGVAQVRTEHDGAETVVRSEEDNYVITVYVDADPNRISAWIEYFASFDAIDEESDCGEQYCQFSTEAVYLHWVEIETEIN